MICRGTSLSDQIGSKSNTGNRCFELVGDVIDQLLDIISKSQLITVPTHDLKNGDHNKEYQ